MIVLRLALDTMIPLRVAGARGKLLENTGAEPEDG